MKLILILGYGAFVLGILTKFALDMTEPWRFRRKLRRFAKTKHLYRIKGFPHIVDYDIMRSFRRVGYHYNFRPEVQEWVDEFMSHPMGILPEVEIMEYYQTLWFDSEADMIYFKLYWHDKA